MSNKEKKQCLLQKNFRSLSALIVTGQLMLLTDLTQATIPCTKLLKCILW